MAKKPTNVYFALDLGAMRKSDFPTADIYQVNQTELVVATHTAFGTDATAVLDDDSERQLVKSYDTSHADIVHKGKLVMDQQLFKLFQQDDLTALAKNLLKPN